ncbi:hypothetical protein EYF80_006816 [Liparis tanakae]|uniref:Uncharacterized protein n=1 Tax=Liparis tanakae TaxID=230148 RepID=A0A4Z2IXZ9_9TELE|nr:hypothetical protein EYF80_006816 [Liparis tanakae]
MEDRLLSLWSLWAIMAQWRSRHFTKATRARDSLEKSSCYLSGQRHLDGHRDDLSQQTAVESHPEHARVAVGIHQCHL